MVGTYSIYSNPLTGILYPYKPDNKKPHTKHSVGLFAPFYNNNNSQFVNQHAYYSFDTIDSKLQQLASIKDNIIPASKGAQFSTRNLISKTADRKYELFRTFDGEIQVNYYKDKSEPLEIYVSYRHYEVLFPDDTEATFCKIKDILATLNKYYEA